ncbi:MAG: hypothetical protein AAGF11_14960 [Myxococcota bacterium]
MTRLAPSARSPVALEAEGPSGPAIVRVQPMLAEPHRPPWWERPTRLAVLVVAGLGLPWSGVAWVGVLGAVWLVLGLAMRYPVRLRPGRALFHGGLRNTDRPGRYWLRRRWFDHAYSIPLDVLRIDWRPAPTRLRGRDQEPWLELDLEVWVRPCADEAGQFTALMNYWVWHQHPGALAKQLREQVVGAVVERLDPAHVRSRTEDRGIDLEPAELLEALDRGLGRLGLERVATGRARARVRSRTEDLSSADRVVVDAEPPPRVLR